MSPISHYNISIKRVIILLTLLMLVVNTAVYLGKIKGDREKVAILVREDKVNWAISLHSLYRNNLSLDPYVFVLEYHIQGEINKTNIRRLIKSLYDMGFRRFTILGDGDLIPSDFGHGWDLYYADVVPFNNPDKIPDVIIGRIPADYDSEFNRYLEKLSRYLTEETPDRILLIGARYADNYFPEGAEFLEKAYWLYLSGYPADRLYYVGDTVPVDPRIPLGYMSSNKYWFVAYSGHGSFRNWYINSGGIPVPEPKIDSNSVYRSLNNEFPFIVFSDGCSTGKFYLEEGLDIFSIAESFLFAEHGGAVAYVGNANEVYVDSVYTRKFFSALNASEDIGTAVYNFIRSLMYGDRRGWVLLGDPNIPIKKPSNIIEQSYIRTVSGLVYDAYNGRPVNNVTIELTQARIRSMISPPWSFRYSSRTNSEGKFLLNTAPTLVNISINRKGYYNWTSIVYMPRSLLTTQKTLIFPLVPANISNYTAIIFNPRTDYSAVEFLENLCPQFGLNALTFKMRYIDLEYNSRMIGEPDILIWIGPNNWGSDGRASAYAFSAKIAFHKYFSMFRAGIIVSPAFSEALIPIPMGLYLPIVKTEIRNSLERINNTDYLGLNLPRIRIIRDVSVYALTPVPPNVRPIYPIYASEDGTPLIFHFSNGTKHWIYIGVPWDAIHPADREVLLRNALSIVSGRGSTLVSVGALKREKG